YSHVTDFYKSISKDALELGLKYNIPPASILAIAGVESGYGRGYVAKITGNILSLGAKKGEHELPPLYLPNDKKSNEILFLPSDIANYKENELRWKKRAKSLKKDYRPSKIAGTNKNLDYFHHNPDKFIKANKECMRDFSSVWINKKSNIPAFKESRIWLEKEIEKNSKEILFSLSFNKKFIHSIGGKKLSFNYRKTWPIKVKAVMKNAGLVELMHDMKNGKSFNESW
ncbi:MAG: glucosaminidase domain-containing protein, partial [Sulfurimonas sp.]|nr:glucosaminidase domain-containing protein [Sulfurimonas sp.]